MGMNCARGQWAWIDVPRDAGNKLLGLTQLQGHVVRTVRLLTGVGITSSTWKVDPPQRCRVNGLVGPLKPGDVMNLLGIPDAYLRPFPDLPPEELEQLVKEVSQ